MAIRKEEFAHTNSQGFWTKSKRLRKKAFFFTVTAILFITIIIIFASVKSRYTLTNKAVVIGNRVETMNNFIIDFEKDVKRGLYISGHRAMLSLIENIHLNNGTYIDDFNVRMTEAMISGSVKGQNTTLMEDSMINDWMSSVTAQGSNLNIGIDFKHYELNIYQTEPWHITVAMNASLVFNDSSGLATWYVDDIFTTDIDIRGFEDPLYTSNSGGRAALLVLVNGSIFDNNFTFKKGSQWNTSNLYNHMLQGLYIHNPDAPSFIMRFLGNISGNSTCCGIESLVNLQKRDDQGLTIYSRSIVDHVYFTGISGNHYHINWTPSWFRIDNGHFDNYNITNDVLD